MSRSLRPPGRHAPDAAQERRQDPIESAARNWRRSGWADAADGMAAVTSVMRVHQLLLAKVEEVLRPYVLTFARYEVLMLLIMSRTGELPLAVVGSRLQVHPASVTGLVKRLERDGLVARRTDPDDGRARRVSITELGRSVALTATEHLNARVFGQGWIAGDGGRTLLASLTDLRAAIGDLGTASPVAGDEAH